MEAATSSIDNESSSTTSTTYSQSTLPLPLPVNNNNNNILIPTVAGKLSPPPLGGSLCRMGSGTSVIIDSENGIEAESRKLPSSKYKGVVPQPNGRWGAQIYEKHQRVWLGTFNEEDEAARSYDVAAQRFRGRDAVTNFKPLSSEEEAGAAELRFLNSRSKAEIVDMLRKHTYHDELHQSRRNLKLLFEAERAGCNSGNNKSSLDIMGNNIQTGRGSGPSREQLFEKVVTPSDVGKLNRLVIPKQHAEKHFPLQGGSGTCSSASPASSTTNTTSSTKGVLLNFEDINEKVWRFRYSYWNSSQSYVLTKGWSRFVKEKNLKAGDVVIFQRSTGPDRQLYIDWKPRTNNINNNGPQSEAVLGRVVNVAGPVDRPGQMLRLFGVDICKVAADAAVVVVSGNGKRMREVELLAMESSNKKQMVVAAL